MTIQRRPIVWGGRGKGPRGGGGGSGLWTPGGGGPIPPTPNFAAGLNSLNSPPGTPLTWDRSGDNPGAGWWLAPTIGTILSAVIVAGRVAHILANDAIRVRCETYAQLAASIVPAGSSVTLTMEQVAPGGGVTTLGSDTQSTVGGGYFNPINHIDVHDAILSPGDIVRTSWTTSGFANPGGGNFGANDTWIRVGAGSITLDGGGTIWVGP